MRVTAIQPSITYYNILFSNGAVPGAIGRRLVSFRLVWSYCNNLQLTRKVRSPSVNRHKELEGILISRGVKRREALVGLVDDVIEGGHLVLLGCHSRDSEDHRTRIFSAPWSRMISSDADTPKSTSGYSE